MTQTTNVIDFTNTQGDLVDQLLAQHQQVKAAINNVAKTETVETRQEAFDVLRELLARHETAEEMIVRPLTRGIDGGREVASALMDQENEAKVTLAELEKLDIASVKFARQFEKFALAVLTHAQAEEIHEFPLLRQDLNDDQLRGAERLLLLAERTAPTHPHPTARTTALNYIAGPFAAMVDRARDTIKSLAS